MSEFIAFHAAVSLLKDRGMEYVIDDVYKKSKAQIDLPKEQVVNYVKEVYAPFTDEEIADKYCEYYQAAVSTFSKPSGLTVICLPSAATVPMAEGALFRTILPPSSISTSTVR